MLNNITIIQLERKFDRFTSCMMELRKLHSNYNISFQRAIDHRDDNFNIYFDQVQTMHGWLDPHRKTQLKLGEIGCALSHHMAWKNIIDNNIDWTLILEDDFVFKENFETILSTIKLDDLPNCDILYLGRKPLCSEKDAPFVTINMDTEITFNILKPCFSYWTIGYIISKQGAQKLIDSNYLHNLIPIDEWIPFMSGAEPDHWNMPEKNMIIGKLNAIKNNTTLQTFAVNPTIVEPSFNKNDISETENSQYIDDRLSEYKSPEPQHKILVISVATDPIDGFILWEETAKHFNYTYNVLGMNTEWKGGDMKISPGGGQKICIAKDWLQNIKKTELYKQYTHVMFTDAYDVFFNADLETIWSKYEKMVDSIDTDFLFSAETQCWPKKEYVSIYPDPYVHNNVKYLNSGMWIGPINKLESLWNVDILPHEDDQGYYTDRYLFPVEDGGYNIKLDYFSEIFLNLQGISDISLMNEKKQNVCVIHGNGQQYNKLQLLSLSNYYPSEELELPTKCDNYDCPDLILYRFYENDRDNIIGFLNLFYNKLKTLNNNCKILIICQILKDYEHISKLTNDYDMKSNLNIILGDQINQIDFDEIKQSVWVIDSKISFKYMNNNNVTEQIKKWCNQRFSIIPMFEAKDPDKLKSNFLGLWNTRYNYKLFKGQQSIELLTTVRKYWSIAFGYGMITIPNNVWKHESIRNIIVQNLGNWNQLQFYAEICENLHKNDNFIYLDANDNFGFINSTK
jgi:GR25 family glycosyltransferase involved in LPS biosynthesis